MTPHQILAVQKLGSAVLEAIEHSGDLGAPSGVMYAALSSQGCTLQQYQSLMGSMKRRGLVSEEGDCYTITEAGKQFRRLLDAKLAQEAA